MQTSVNNGNQNGRDKHGEKWDDILIAMMNDQTEFLRYITSLDLKIFIGFLTFEGAAIAFFPKIQAPIQFCWVIAVQFGAAICASALIIQHRLVRIQVQKTLKNIRRELDLAPMQITGFGFNKLWVLIPSIFLGAGLAAYLMLSMHVSTENSRAESMTENRWTLPSGTITLESPERLTNTNLSLLKKYMDAWYSTFETKTPRPPPKSGSG